MVATVDHTMSDDESDRVDPIAHQKLLAGINSIVRTQDVQKVSRTEPINRKSEFHLVKAQFSENDSAKPKAAVKLDDLLGILKKSGKKTTLGKELVQVKDKKKTLRKPLEKPVADRIERDTLYGKTQKNLDLWEPVVTAGDAAPQTVFPLQYGKVDLANEAPQKLSQYRVKSDLMKAMEELDSKYQKEEVEEVEQDQYALTLEELRQKRKEAARQKMREAYKISKGRRMNKIKSKKFHKLMKREKIRNQIKQFEELQKTDPEAALKQLELIEKQRYQERASLRHKNTGSWAKNMQIRAKYDMNVRQEIEEQLSIGKELMAKRLAEDESSESGEEEVVEPDDDDEDNPWVRKKGDHEEEGNREFTSGYRKYWEQRNKVEEIKKQIQDEEIEVRSEHDEREAEEGEDSEDERQLEMFKKKVIKSKAISTSAWEEEDQCVSEEKPSKKKKKSNRQELNLEEIFDDAQELLQQKVQQKLANVQKLSAAQKIVLRRPKNSQNKRKAEDKGKSNLAFKKKVTLADADIALDETAGNQKDDSRIPHMAKFFTEDKLQDSATATSSSEITINPKQFVQMKPKHMLNAIPDLTTGGELSDDEDPEHSQKLTIAEAFEDDDIVADFEREKQDERDRTKPKELVLFLPGWGSWGGSGINERKAQKTRRKMFKAPPVFPRRDDNQDRVILNEDAVSKKLTSHLVNELPFPFVSVKDYEASMRAPLGRTFLPETAHLTLVEPRVVTKMGAIIEPMKKDILLQDVNKSFQVGGKQYNKAVKKYEEFLEQNELSQQEQK
ncbi:U3 small nucleolar RNA-associated protein 14 homolog A [Ochlerotatus camptorhynchus]|uniref:U3 small nucleolar RNA-associated protein 14 homolog A n=1 Tax=Ochlerotatus camptorhynchus TaxID=644619 RepID=UPI0031D85880